MKQLVAGVLVVVGCGDNKPGAAAPDAPIPCAPFSVTANGDANEVQPVWAGGSWALARPGLYVRIDGDGTITNTEMLDLAAVSNSNVMQSLAYDGVELGYFYDVPLPHLVLFSPDDPSTRHVSPSFGHSSSVRVAGSVRADPTGAPRIEAFFTDFYAPGLAVHGWSDGSSLAEPQEQSFAIALAPETDDEMVGHLGGLAAPFIFGFEGGPSGGASLGTSPGAGQPVQIAASGRAAIVRNWGTWKVAGQTATPITTPPVAWSGRAFVTYDQGALQLYDADFQPRATRALTVSGTTLLGVGATSDRALLVFQGAGPSNVDYVQVCL